MASHGDRETTVTRLRSGELALLVAAAGYGVGTSTSVVALRSVRPVDLLAVELSGAAVLLLGAAALTGRLRRRGAVRQLLLGALVPGLAFLLGDYGLARTSASSGSLLLSAEPLLAVVLAVVVLRERMTGRAVTALVIGLAGSVLVAVGPGASRSGSAESLGNLLVLAAVAAGAVFLVATRHYSADDADGLNASAWQTTGGLVTVAPFVLASWGTGGSLLPAANTAAWASCLGVLLCGAVAGAAFNRGIARVPAARAGQLANLTPVAGTVTAVVFLGERPAPLALLGGTAILIGLVLLLRTAPTPAAEPALSDSGQARNTDDAAPSSSTATARTPHN